MNLETEFIALLRSWCFDDTPGKPVPELLPILHRLDLLRFCRFFFPDMTFAPEFGDVPKRFLIGSAIDIQQQSVMPDIAAILQTAGIPVCPFKGFAVRRFYQHPGLRIRGDIDLLLPAGRTRQAAQLLRQAGWRMPRNYWHPHHEPTMRRGPVQLELHHTLPGFRRQDMPQVWPLLNDTNGTLELPYELNLLMLFAHFGSHDWRLGVGVLLDFGYIVRRCGAPDWELIARYAKQFRLHSPALFFAAFPDFFPAATLPPQQFTDADKQLMREMTLSEHADDALHTVMGVTNRFTAEWWRQRLEGLSTANVRRQTGNHRGHYLRLWYDYFRLNLPKIAYFCRGLKQTDQQTVRLLRALNQQPIPAASPAGKQGV